MPTLVTERLILRPIHTAEATALLDGQRPDGLTFADDYPAEFSLEVMGMVVSNAAEPPGQRPSPPDDAGADGTGGPFFIVRREGDEILGEIGCSVEPATRTGMTGYGLVPSAWGRGYATEALAALLEHALSLPYIDRVVGDAPIDRPASGRVMARAGMTVVGQRTEEVDGTRMRLERYERTV